MKQLPSAIEKLQEQFPSWDWSYRDIPAGPAGERMYRWPGPPEEDIMITVHKSTGVQELFHRHDFFFFNYTYKGQYDSLSHKYDNRVTIREKELYAGQPFAGHALLVHNNFETIIIGVLIRKESFFQSFLPLLSNNIRLFRFFIDPSTNSFSDEFLHFRPPDDCAIRTLLELMVIEYANKKSDSQTVLRSLVLAFLMLVSRQYEQCQASSEGIAERMLQYIADHLDSVSLKALAREFSYHPGYVSSLLHSQTGRTFSQLVLEQRMQRALLLLRGTSLPVSEIAAFVGFSNTSNFYKAFRRVYAMSPREYISRLGNAGE